MKGIIDYSYYDDDEIKHIWIDDIIYDEIEPSHEYGDYIGD